MSTLHTILTAANDFLAHVPAVDIPNPNPQQPPGTGGITTIMAWLKWIGYAVVGGSIIVGGILIAVSFRRGEGHDALPKILWPMAGAIVIGAGAAWIGTIAGG
ncbi:MULTISPECIES: hypothetical protein [Leifsonia]|uniref:Uncharacterized protein n=3 Tax=Leifsonia TaxID=110932 RepID=U2RXP0_LEIAQ|nr:MULTISPECIES: hypothetical protein [Leifsonia]ERK73486.1 hypothetical protein N136_00169 [Leifsonia aquatica ATCC 14665]MBB2969461.1 hypothetical protein [Leifsonia aquatica]MDN4599553.1 hypothetical protein [Leifsonia virtsii]